jgi:hypothetical protein
MNWDAVSALADLGGTFAVLVTLVYLSIQVRQANEQRKGEAYRHILDSLNHHLDSLTQSRETIAILTRGRVSLGDLTEDERLIFELIHIRVLNSLESYYEQQIEEMPPGIDRDRQIENLVGIAQWYFAYPGAAEIWQKIRHFYSIQGYVDRSAGAGTETEVRDCDERRGH